MSLLTLLQKGTDSNAGVEVARVVGVEDAPAVDAAARGFQLFDDFHCTNFRRAAQRSGGEASAESIDGVELGAELAFDAADDVHDMRVALDVHQLLYFDRTIFAH